MSRNPIVMTLPPFSGVTRQLVLTAVVVFLAFRALDTVQHEAASFLMDRLMLHPDQTMRGQVWQFATYPFVSVDLLGTLFSALSLWFFGSALEGERGRRWFGEYFFSSVIGGAILVTALSWTIFRHTPDLWPTRRAYGLWGPVMALIVAFAHFHAEEELTFNFIIRVKAKYFAVIYLLVYLALAFTDDHRFDALTVLCVSLAGYLYLRYAPRQGLRFLASERAYGIRNAFYRRKRKQAAKKFTVYMRDQGKEVHFDAQGKYISPEEEQRDPKDKKWMN